MQTPKFEIGKEYYTCVKGIKKGKIVAIKLSFGLFGIDDWDYNLIDELIQNDLCFDYLILYIKNKETKAMWLEEDLLSENKDF